MQKTAQNVSRAGLPLHSHLRSGAALPPDFTITSLGTFNRALIEHLQLANPWVIPDELVQECAASPIAGLTCVHGAASQGSGNLLEFALNDIAEVCKQQGGGQACDNWGSWYGLRFR